MAQTHIARRKALKKKASKATGTPISDLEWRDSVLLVKSTGEPVADIPKVSKD